MVKQPWTLRVWGIKLWIGILMVGLLGGGGEIITCAEEPEQKTEQKQKGSGSSPPQSLARGTVRLVDVDNYTKMRILRTRGNRTIKLVIEDLPIQTFGMSNYEMLVDAHSAPEAQASLPAGRYPAKLYRRHKEYDEALNIRLNEVDDNSKPKSLFIEVKPDATTTVRCYARDYSEIKFEVLMEE